MSGEWKIPRLVCPLVRIDPGEEEPDDADDFVHLQLGAREGLEQLALVLEILPGTDGSAEKHESGSNAIATVGSRPVKAGSLPVVA
eukprot:s1089_g16.t1